LEQKLAAMMAAWKAELTAVQKVARLVARSAVLTAAMMVAQSVVHLAAKTAVPKVYCLAASLAEQKAVQSDIQSGEHWAARLAVLLADRMVD
jgi:hypothetical protein